MSRIPPRSAFRVVVYVRAGDKQFMESHNYDNLAGAIAYRDIVLTKRWTRKVEVTMVIDESSPSHKD